MKLKFKHQRFQSDAAKAVCDVFAGQRFSEGFSYRIDQGEGSTGALFDLGIRNNPLDLDRRALADNIRRIQLAQGIKPIDSLVGDGLNITIEMETGTGKTYTYIKTMFELNKRYGWCKFIIVVPSIAIREGVCKSFQIMQDHFADEYGKRIQFFVYDSAQPTKIDTFASDSNMYAMIINTQAFNARGKDARRIRMKLDSFRSRRPIDILAATNPILIIDEPQSVLGTNRDNATRAGLQEFKPLFTLLYSATHRADDIYNMVYRLDAMDAYNKHLVKKIDVIGTQQIGTTATNGYLYLEKIIISQGNPVARLGHDRKTATGVKQIIATVSERYNVYEKSGELSEYENHLVVESIDGIQRCVRFLNGLVLYEGQSVGAVNEDYVRRQQIHETIKAHLEKERSLYGKGIKVLSLFFIDHVENYRKYGDNGAEPGKFATMFEEEYQNAVESFVTEFGDTDYMNYLGKFTPAQVHQGYFSIDKKGHMVNPKLERGSTDSSDSDAYDLIMRNKEQLLSLKEPVRFIFSHSALKEGWDNPNVFQICTLKDSDNTVKKRQEVGRGMRLCVNQDGERQDEDVLGAAVFDINVLTVIASQSYDEFANGLQTEIANEVTDRPKVITAELFVGTSMFVDGYERKLTEEDAACLQENLVAYGYVKRGQLTQKYFDDKKTGTLNFGDEYKESVPVITRVLDSVFNPSAIKPENRNKAREARFDEEKFKKAEFQELWKKINVKTYYTVDFETKDLIERSINELNAKLFVTQIRVVVTTGSLERIESKEALLKGKAMKVTESHDSMLREIVGASVRYDLVGQLVESTQLTRKTIVDILKGISAKTFSMFKANPEEFIIKTAAIINSQKALSVIQHIAYHRMNATYDSDIFSADPIRGQLGRNAIESNKSLYDLVVMDSQNEVQFAEQLEMKDEIVVYSKLPRGFYINTPMGHYNPDWAIVFKEGDLKHIYFVAETKAALLTGENRGVEEAKIECAKRHFASISGNSVKYDLITSYEHLLSVINN